MDASDAADVNDSGDHAQHKPSQKTWYCDAKKHNNTKYKVAIR